jgi:hypothetical protein
MESFEEKMDKYYKTKEYYEVWACSPNGSPAGRYILDTHKTLLETGESTDHCLEVGNNYVVFKITREIVKKGECKPW